MKKRTEKDLWIEMSIREIYTQTRFASLAFENIDINKEFNTDIIFSSIHSFLAHCANVSKMLKAIDDETGITIGGILGISNDSIVHKRRFRNHLEHYDDRLKNWISKKNAKCSIGTYNIGPKELIGVPNLVFVSHYDPDKKIFTFIDEDIDIEKLKDEAERIGAVSDEWVKNNWLHN